MKHVCAYSGIEFETTNGWVKCSDSLPACWTNVLVTDGKRIGFGFYTIDKGQKVFQSHQGVKDVWWHSLPDAPQENKHD